MTQKKSVKSIVFSNQKMTCSKATYATVCNAIANKPNIDLILNHDMGKLKKALEISKARNVGLMYILLSELLFSKYQSIRGGGQLKRKITQYEEALRDTRSIVVSSEQNSESRSIVFPRYVRVNNLKTRLEHVVDELRGILDSKGLSEEKIYLDNVVPDLLVVNPKISFPWHEFDLVKEGKVILQDKSSCFSALALVNGNEKAIDGDIIDACAAPGNKTCHLASLLYKQILFRNKEASRVHTVFAFDRSSTRIKILNDRMTMVSPSFSGNVNKSTFPVQICPIHQDFLQVNPNEKRFQNVKAILLDPSCSGSGIVNTPDRFADKNFDSDEKRLSSLSSFQLVALKHAMSFPNVERIVYSTCSIHQQENENVVAAALRECNSKMLDKSLQWNLVSPLSLREWPRRGLKHHDLSVEEMNCLVRVDGLDGDNTNGFFVSYFERGEFLSSVNDAVHRVKLVHGVDSIYKGQFQSDEKTSPDTGGKKKKNNVLYDSLQEKERENNQQKLIAKKKEKRLNWKKKQSALKRNRLKQKTK